jgi:alkylation response protein AidB-like acyl-CoA dehydrogenase
VNLESAVAAEVTAALGAPSSGEATAVVWHAVSSGEPADAGVDADVVGSTWRLTGDVDTVLWPEGTRSLLVVSHSRPLAGRARGLRVHRVGVDAPNVSHEVRPLLAGTARRVRLAGVEVSGDDAVGPSRDAVAMLSGAFDRLCIAAVSEMLAAADAALATAVEWISTRQQFGAPLALRQAVQHRAADMAMSCAVVRGLVEDAQAAASAATCGVEAAVAKLIANTRLPDVTASAHQLHGGEGYYADRELHLLHKRVSTLAALFGNGARQRARLARLLAD